MWVDWLMGASMHIHNHHSMYKCTNTQDILTLYAYSRTSSSIGCILYRTLIKFHCDACISRSHGLNQMSFIDAYAASSGKIAFLFGH